MIPNEVANSFSTADALVFFVETKEIATQCRISLVEAGLSTKILPEAITWHFAGKWGHMKELDLKKNNFFKKSKNYLDKFVSLQIFYNMDKKYPLAIEQTIKEIT